MVKRSNLEEPYKRARILAVLWSPVNLQKRKNNVFCHLSHISKESTKLKPGEVEVGWVTCYPRMCDSNIRFGVGTMKSWVTSYPPYVSVLVSFSIMPFNTNSGYSRWFEIVPAKLMKTIKIRGARTHNLANIDLDLPRDKLIVVTGLSGSGKSSLAFDTIYAEGQRRYVESLSAYARQFLSVMEKPDIDHIEGL